MFNKTSTTCTVWFDSTYESYGCPRKPLKNMTLDLETASRWQWASRRVACQPPLVGGWRARGGHDVRPPEAAPLARREVSGRRSLPLSARLLWRLAEPPALDILVSFNRCHTRPPHVFLARKRGTRLGAGSESLGKQHTLWFGRHVVVRPLRVCKSSCDVVVPSLLCSCLKEDLSREKHLLSSTSSSAWQLFRHVVARRLSRVCESSSGMSGRLLHVRCLRKTFCVKHTRIFPRTG